MSLEIFDDAIMLDLEFKFKSMMYISGIFCYAKTKCKIDVGLYPLVILFAIFNLICYSSHGRMQQAAHIDLAWHYSTSEAS